MGPVVGPAWSVAALSGLKLTPAFTISPFMGAEVARRLSDSTELFAQGTIAQDRSAEALAGLRVRF